jgi:FKBP-type peptidyl-prolyl cis-trans isomerase
MSRRLLALILTATLAIAAAGCGSSNDNSTSSSASASSDTTSTQAQQQPATAQPRPKPTVHVPKGKPPKKLVVKDLIKGTGPAAKPGDPITVNYIGVNYKGGKPFDNSYDRGQPFPFQLGGGQVISGWDNGLVGMKVGGRRMLIIPPSQGYGAQGQPPVIKPNETLVFVVDLLSIG